MQLTDMPATADEFLRQTRIGTLVHAAEPWPNAVPVWYEWTGTEVLLFTRGDRPKVRRLREDPRVSLAVSAEVAEVPYWVAIEGTATLDGDAGALVERLCDKYCDLEAESGRALKADIMSVADSAVMVRISADRVRHFR